MSSDVAIEVENLGKCYHIYDRPRDRLLQIFATDRRQYYREFWALRNISMQIKQGESVGIIGRNGSGKSTLLQLVCGTLSPTTGSVRTHGRVAALLELGAGFNPEFTGRENVYMNASLLGLTREQTDQRFERIEAFADIGRFIDQPVKTYSSGMFVRLAFAVQAHVDASIVVIDEALAVGDVFYRQKCFSRIRELVDNGATVLLVTHDLANVTQFCNNVLVLNEGQEVYRGEPVSAIRRYMAIEQATRTPAFGFTQTAGKSGSHNRDMATPKDFEWPSADMFCDASEADIVGNGWAEFVGVAVCDTDGEPTRFFQIGEAADFFVEYRLLQDINVPIGGVTIVNDKGILVHGKNSMQHRVSAPNMCRRGDIVRFKQRIILDISPGEYTFVVGLATTDVAAYENCQYISNDDLAGLVQRVLSVGRAGAFTVGFCREGIALSHHGLANLPGKCELFIVDANGEESKW